MPVDVLRCRICRSEYPAAPNGICAKCFGPLEPVYDWETLKRTVSRASIEAGPRSLWRYADLLPAVAPPDPASAPGMTPLVSAPRLASLLGVGEVLLKLDLSNPTHSFKDRVVAVAAAKAAEFRFETLSATSTGNLANAVAARAAATGMRALIFCPVGLEREKVAATTIYGATIYSVRGSYDDCSRLVSELAGEVEWGIVNVNLRSYYSEGSKTLAYEIVEQLGWELPTAVVMPIGSGAMYTKVYKGFGEFLDLGLVEGTRPKLFGGQAEGCAPVASAFAEDRRVTPVRPDSVVSSIAIGNPADGDLTVALAKSSGGGIFSVPEHEVGQNIALLAETAGVYGEGATGVAIGALREAVRRGELGEHDRVVVLVTGTGLKTPQLAQASGVVIEIDPDVDAVLSEIGGGSVTEPSSTTEQSGTGDIVVDTRAAITATDLELLAGINRRIDLVRALHEHKVATGMPLWDAGREEAMLEGMRGANDGTLSEEGVRELLAFLLDLTRKEVHGR